MPRTKPWTQPAVVVFCSVGRSTGKTSLAGGVANQLQADHAVVLADGDLLAGTLSQWWVDHHGGKENTLPRESAVGPRHVQGLIESAEPVLEGALKRGVHLIPAAQWVWSDHHRRDAIEEIKKLDDALKPLDAASAEAKGLTEEREMQRDRKSRAEAEVGLTPARPGVEDLIAAAQSVQARFLESRDAQRRFWTRIFKVALIKRATVLVDLPAVGPNGLLVGWTQLVKDAKSSDVKLVRVFVYPESHHGHTVVDPLVRAGRKDPQTVVVSNFASATTDPDASLELSFKTGQPWLPGPVKAVTRWYQDELDVRDELIQKARTGVQEYLESPPPDDAKERARELRRLVPLRGAETALSDSTLTSHDDLAAASATKFELFCTKLIAAIGKVMSTL